MRSLPTGTVTFLFTDIEGSTALLQQLPDAYGTAMGNLPALLELDDKLYNRGAGRGILPLSLRPRTARLVA